MMKHSMGCRWLATSLVLASACATNVVGADDEAGTTTRSDSAEPDSETGGEEPGSIGELDALCGGAPIGVTLTGAASPLDSCDSFVFSGSLVEQIDANTWLLDSCGCDEDCDAADPYELVIDFKSTQLAIPPVPSCLQIELQRDDGCYLSGVTVSEIGATTKPAWTVGSWYDLNPGFEWFVVYVTAKVECSEPDEQGSQIIGWRLMVISADTLTEVEIKPDEAIMVEDPNGQLFELRTAYSASNSNAPLGGQSLDYFLVAQ